MVNTRGACQKWHVLDFHHTDKSKKTATVSQMPNSGTAKEKIIAEIKKCIILC